MDASTYSALQGAFVRMVVPLRREFGITLDVQRMRRDIDYAQSAVALALISRSPVLHRYAAMVAGHIRAARARATHEGVAAH